MSRTRRQFLENVGSGMLLAGLGTALATDLGVAEAIASDVEGELTFGDLEPLVALMQETPASELTALLVDKLKRGTDLKTLVAAGALSNARTFGGQDYIGMHTFMALAPAYRMALELPADQRALPVLKVLYRNADRIQAFGGRKSETLHAIHGKPIPPAAHPGEHLREVARTGDIELADRTFAALADIPIGEAFNHLQYEIEEEVDVHRVVLAWRAMDTLDLAGERWGHCMLRQSIRYCANTERNIQSKGGSVSPIRTVLPQLLDQYRLLGRERGQKPGDDQWLGELAQSIFRGTREQAADAVAQSLVEGFSPEAIGEAISVASNMLVLHDPGRPEQWSNAEKPAGSCHGDSVGVHASDAANAWRNIVRVSNWRNVVASLIVGAFHTGGQSGRSNPQPYPFAEHLAEVRSEGASDLINAAEEAVRANDQLKAAAIVARYGELGHEPRKVLDVLLKYAVSEDGALHAEKYYHTVTAEFASTRKAFRWGQLVALARVTASQYGHSSPGFQQAKKLLHV